MKKFRTAPILCFLIFLFSCTNNSLIEKKVDASADSSKAKMDCCKNDSSKKLLICSLTSAELDERKTTVLDLLHKKVLEKKELRDGYSFRFSGSDSTIDLLTDFIKSERQCCAFFTFNLQIEDAKSSAWLTIIGPQGSKDFMTDEMKF